jgi:GMP synthase-like glutamine amidotransferase
VRDIAVLRFSPTEGPGRLADWLDARRIPWRLLPVDAGAAVPVDAREFAGLALMGGPMSVNDPLPWIEPVCELLRAAVAAGVPVLGHCLGGQLLAKAMGAAVTRARVAEIGWIDVDVAPSAAARDWFGGRTGFTTFQWHYDAFARPPGALPVLTNGFNANQGYVLDDRHLGLQCHVEMTEDLVASWLATGGTELPVESTPSLQSAADIARDRAARVAALNAVADDVYARWARGLAGASVAPRAVAAGGEPPPGRTSPPPG